MPTPKHKGKRYSRDARRAANALEAFQTAKCPRCSEEKLPHRACRNCGFYKDFDVLKLDKE